MITKHAKCAPFTTRDGSIIRELMHPEKNGGQNQSLAEAMIPAGNSTLLHCHHRSEELYHITTGHGVMQLGDEAIHVRTGDTVLIPPGTPHAIKNSGNEALTILCCCAPAYSHEDTELL